MAFAAPFFVYPKTRQNAHNFGFCVRKHPSIRYNIYVRISEIPALFGIFPLEILIFQMRKESTMQTLLLSLCVLNIVTISFAVALLLRNATKNDGSVQQIGEDVKTGQTDLARGQQEILRRTDTIQNSLAKSQSTTAAEVQKAINSSTEVSVSRLGVMDKNIAVALSEMDKNLSEVLANKLNALQSANEKKLSEIIQAQNTNAGETQKALYASSKEAIERMSRMEKSVTETLSGSLEIIRETNEAKLSELQRSVSEKLDKSLNERLDSSFAKVTEQLSELYKSLGELSEMSSNISSLNRSLSNVKVRGTWGEAQLRDIIQETMVPSQYEENVVTKPGSNDPVEFAIKIPSKENNSEYILLPIDSKFPMDRYNEVVDAAEEADKAKLNTAIKQLEMRVKSEAMKIRDKYISVPKTTNFAVMYLPTESLYAEVLRINGLAEQCQNQYGIIIAGPTTITALLNSLRVGFQNLTLSKKTNEIRKLLVAVKLQFDKMDELIAQTQKKLDAASDANEKLAKRSGMIQKRLSKISTDMPEEEKVLLGDPGMDMALSGEVAEDTTADAGDAE